MSRVGASAGRCVSSPRGSLRRWYVQAPAAAAPNVAARTANATAWWTPTMAGAAYRRRLLALGLARVGRRNRGRSLVGRRVGLRNLRRFGRIALVRRRIRWAWPRVFWPGGGGFAADASNLVGRDHDRVLYRETRAPNPLVSAR